MESWSQSNSDLSGHDCAYRFSIQSAIQLLLDVESKVIMPYYQPNN